MLRILQAIARQARNEQRPILCRMSRLTMTVIGFIIYESIVWYVSVRTSIIPWIGCGLFIGLSLAIHNTGCLWALPAWVLVYYMGAHFTRILTQDGTQTRS